MEFKKLPFVRKADEGDCSAKITDASPKQIELMADGTGLPPDLLRACRFKHKPAGRCVYNAWDIASGFYPNRTKYEPILSIAKIIAIVIPVLKEHVDEGLIRYEEIHVMDNQTTPDFKSVASLYSKQLGLLESSEDTWKFVINLPKELMDTENWPKYNHGGEFTYQDIEDVLQSPPKELEPKENEEPEEKESIYHILKQMDQKLWANFQGFLDWIHIHYNTEKKYETKARKAIFYVQGFDNRLKITPESSGNPIFLSTNELRKHFNVSVAEFSHHFGTLFESATYEYGNTKSGGMIASYWPVILEDYVRWCYSHGKPPTSAGAAMNLPTFSSIMKPLLAFLGEGQKHPDKWMPNPHTVRGDIEDHLAKHFGLSDEQVKHEKPSGGEPLFLHTIRWGVTHLKYAELIFSVAENRISITAKGLRVLKENPDEITEAYLMKFPKYRQKRGKDKQPKVRLLGEKYHQKLEINGNIVTAKNLVPPIMRQFLSDGEWHNKKELDIWLQNVHFRVTEEDLKNAMYFKTGNRKPRTVLYVKAAGAISIIRKAKWLLDSTPGEWKLNNAGGVVSRHHESAIMAKLDELHIPEDIEDDEEMDEHYNPIDMQKINWEKYKLKLSPDWRKILDEIKAELLIDDSTLLHILDILKTDHVLLEGPIGTGKTHLAKMLPKLFNNENYQYEVKTYTATTEWDTQDVIGGIVPKMRGNDPIYDINYGCVVETLRANFVNNEDTKPKIRYWTLIDEFNRAPIDKSFGPLFTALRDEKLRQIPTKKENKTYDQMDIPPDYRIIGTLNSQDRSFLFTMSDALRSRFSSIEIPIPSLGDAKQEIFFAVKQALKELHHENNYSDLIVWDFAKFSHKEENDIQKEIWQDFAHCYRILASVRLFHKLGTALLKNMYKTIITEKDFYMDLAKDPEITGLTSTGLDHAITSTLIPQLGGLTKPELGTIKALHTEGGVEKFFKDAHRERKKSNYEKPFEKVIDYLELGGKEGLLKEFRSDEFSQWPLIQEQHEKMSEALYKFTDKKGITKFIRRIEELEENALI